MTAGRSAVSMPVSFEGRVFSGMGKGRYYVGHPEYQKRFEGSLGYRPYPGTLNVKLDEENIGKMRELRATEGVRIPGFMVDGESMSALRCFNGEMRGERVTLLFIDVTHYNDTVSELISPAFLRGKFGIKDGDVVEFTAGE